MENPAAREVIFIGGNHEDPTAVIALTQSLPRLFQLGYVTVFMELTTGEAEKASDLSALIEATEIRKQCVPQFEVDSRDSGYEQHRKYLEFQHMNVLNKNWLLAKIRLFQKMQELKMRLVAIGVPEPQEYQNNLLGVEKRSQFMFEQMKAKCDPSREKGIALLRLSHLINTFDMGFYNYGLLHFVMADPSFNLAKCPAYFIADNVNSSPYKEAVESLNVGSERIRRHTRIIKSTDEMNVDVVLAVPADSVQVKCKFPVATPVPPHQRAKYIEDLGATDIGPEKLKMSGGMLFTFFKARMDVSLINPREKYLSIWATKIDPPLTEEGLAFLKENVVGAAFDPQQEPLRLTFATSGGIAFETKQLHMINQAEQNYRRK